MDKYRDPTADDEREAPDGIVGEDDRPDARQLAPDGDVRDPEEAGYGYGV